MALVPFNHTQSICSDTDMDEGIEANVAIITDPTPPEGCLPTEIEEVGSPVNVISCSPSMVTHAEPAPQANIAPTLHQTAVLTH